MSLCVLKAETRVLQVFFVLADLFKDCFVSMDHYNLKYSNIKTLRVYVLSWVLHNILFLEMSKRLCKCESH